jgi:hypothetical protein
MKQSANNGLLFSNEREFSFASVRKYLLYHKWRYTVDVKDDGDFPLLREGLKSSLLELAYRGVNPFP